MPALPDAASLGARAIPQSQRSIAALDISAPAKALEAGGKQLAGVAEYAVKQQTAQKDEDAKLIEAANANNTIINQFAPEASKLRAEFYGNQGSNAATALPIYEKGLEDLRQRTLATTGNLRTQNLLGHFMVSHVTQELDGANRYATDQTAKYVETSNNGMLDNLISQASVNYTNPTAIGSNMAQGFAIIDSQAKAKGMVDTNTGGSDWADTQKRKFATDSTKSLVSTALANNDTKSANAIYDRFKSSIDPDVSADIYKTLDITNKRQDGLDTVAALKGGVELPARRTVAPSVSAPTDIISVVRRNEIGPGAIRLHEDGDGQAIAGINSRGHPKEFAEIKGILETQGQEAASAYVDKFYQKMANDRGINSLRPEVQDVVLDGLANHWSGFQDKLLNAAKTGASRNELLDMRQAEYSRLAATGESKYVNAKAGWDNRIKGLRDSAPVDAPPAIATPSAATPVFKEGVNPLDTYKNWQAVYPAYNAKVSATADPEDRKGRLDALDAESARYKHASDAYRAGIVNDAMQMAVDPKFTDISQVPMETYKILLEDHPETIKELRTAAESNTKRANKVDSQNEVTNSPNGYDTVTRVLLPNSPAFPNKIGSQDHLDKLIGKPDGRGINMKDYNDAKQGLMLEDRLKEKLLKNMQDIANANGNLDGRGQERALTWYGHVMQEYKTNQGLGKDKLSDDKFGTMIGKEVGPTAPYSPSVMAQIQSVAEAARKGDIPTFDSPDSPDFIKLPPGAAFFVAGEKTPRTKK